MNPSNPASPPSTFPATVEIPGPASPWPSAEEEAAASLLMLAEAVGFEEEFDLADEEGHAVESPVSSAGLSSNIKASVYVNNVALDDDMVKDPEDSTDEEPDGESVGEWPEAEVEELEVEADPLIMPAERWCNARNWNCGNPTQSGSTMCSEHVKVRDELLKNLQAKRLQASTRFDAINWA